VGSSRIRSGCSVVRTSKEGLREISGNQDLKEEGGGPTASNDCLMKPNQSRQENSGRGCLHAPRRKKEKGRGHTFQSLGQGLKKRANQPADSCTRSGGGEFTFYQISPCDAGSHSHERGAWKGFMNVGGGSGRKPGGKYSIRGGALTAIGVVEVKV